MAVVVFDAADFKEAYTPKFDDVSDARLQTVFGQACLIVDNTEKSEIPYEPDEGVLIRKTLLYLLVCHIQSLASIPSGAAGPMTSATEGSVSVGYGMYNIKNGNWYQLTPCGQAFWQAMLPYLIGGRYYGQKHYHPWG